MLKQREILRILFKSYPEKSFRSIADAAKISHNTVSRYYTLIQTAKLDWNAIEALSDEQLKNILHPQKSQLLKNIEIKLIFRNCIKTLQKGVTLPRCCGKNTDLIPKVTFHIRHLLACIVTLFVKPIFFLIRMSIMRVKEHMLIIRG